MRAVFLDRDGVLNHADVWDGKPYAPRALADFHIFPGVEAELGRLLCLGFRLIVVTNQPDVGNGFVSREVVEAMHHHLKSLLPIHDVLACLHSQRDGCECRKPKPGMLLEAARRYGVDLLNSYMIGDRWSDVAAGNAAGCRTIFIDRSYAESYNHDPADWTVPDLAGAVDIIIAQEAKR